MSQKRISRQQEYALEEAENSHFYHYSDYSSYRSEYGRYNGRLSNNTMAPPEDLLHARKEHRVPLSIQHATGQSRNVLIENIILLTILVASIYGLYHLTIYLLNQV